MAVLIITHDLGVVAGFADRLAVMYAGRLVELGPTETLLADPAHPYTVGLLRSLPRLDRPRQAALTPDRGLAARPRLGSRGLSVRAALRLAPDSLLDRRTGARDRRRRTARGCDAGGPSRRLPQPADARRGDRRPAADARLHPGPATRSRRRGPRSGGDRRGAPNERHAHARGHDGGLRPPPRPPRPSPAGPLLTVKDLQVYFPILTGVMRRRTGWVRAVDGVSFTIDRGETLGLVGESGSGKTTIGRSIVRITQPQAGSIDLGGVDLLALKGDDLRRRRRRFQMVFQDPYSSLDPRQTVGDDPRRAAPGPQPRAGQGAPGARRGAARPGRSRHLVRRALSRTSSAAASGSASASPGRSRWSPRSIVCDEPISALDVSIQAQVINLLERLQARPRADLPVHRPRPRRRPPHRGPRRGACTSARSSRSGRPTMLYAQPLHPYTVALLSAVPGPGCRGPSAAASGSSSRATSRARPTRRPAAGSIPAAGSASGSATPRSARPRTRRSPRSRPRSPSQTVACHFAKELVAAPLAADVVPGDRGGAGRRAGRGRRRPPRVAAPLVRRDEPRRPTVSRADHDRQVQPGFGRDVEVVRPTAQVRERCRSASTTIGELVVLAVVQRHERDDLVRRARRDTVIWARACRQLEVGDLRRSDAGDRDVRHRPS